MGIAGAVCLAFVGLTSLLASAPAEALAPVNPVRLTDSVDPDEAANAGFLVFIEGGVSLGGDESEGTVAAGGDLTFTSNYNVAANLSDTFSTPTAPGDERPIGLYVGGGLTWPTDGSILRVLDAQFTKVVGPGELHRARQGREWRAEQLPTDRGW